MRRVLVFLSSLLAVLVLINLVLASDIEVGWDTSMETDPLSIHVDGSSTTTASIPFQRGIIVGGSEPGSASSFIQFIDAGAGGNLGSIGYLSLPEGGASLVFSPAYASLFQLGISGVSTEVDSLDYDLTALGTYNVIAASGGILAGRGNDVFAIKGKDAVCDEFAGDTLGGVVLLHGGLTNEGCFDDPTKAGIVAIAPSISDVPSDVRGNYALFVKGRIYSDDVSASTLLKSDTNKGIVSASAGSDYENPLTFSYPLTRATNTVGLGYNTTNLKQTSNELDTIQGISTGATPSFANLTISGTATTQTGATGATGAIDAGVSGDYEGADGWEATHKFRVYAYKETGGVRVYASTYTEASVTDDGWSIFYEPFHIDVSWTAAAGATGYRILKYQDTDSGATILKNFDFYYDTASTSLIDTGPSFWTPGNTVVPTTNYTNTITSRGQTEALYGVPNIYGSPTIWGNLNLAAALYMYGTRAFDMPPGTSSIFMGVDAGASASGLYNVGLGTDALKTATTAAYNVAIGKGALELLETGTLNLAIGYLAGRKATGNNSVFFGADAGWNVTSGEANTFIGSMSGAAVTDGDYNLFFGYSSGSSITTGNRNVGIGTTTFGGSPVGTNDSIAIGYGATPTGNNQMVLGAFTSPIYETYLGAGPVQNSVAAATTRINATGGYYTNRQAFNLALAGGKSTGNATPGTVLIQTSKVLGSGTTLQTLYDRMSYLNTSAIFNDASEDYDLIMESDGNANMFTMDAGLNRIGIGKASPSVVLDVNGDVGILTDTNTIKFGAGTDASIGFDSNSLNIVANLVTTTDDLEFTAETYTFKTNADTDLQATWWGTTNSGVITWMEDEDYFKFSDGIFMDAAEEVFFRATGNKIYSSATNTLDLVATDIVATGTFKATNYKSGDGSSGVDGGFVAASGETITVKDGLIVDIVSP